MGSFPITRREVVLYPLLPLVDWPYFWRRSSTSIAGIRFRILRNGSAPSRYIVIHGDETTAKEVLPEHMRHYKGTGFLVNSDTRTVMLDGFEFDPNRMFSREGAEKKLRELNGAISPEQLRRALDRLDRERESFLREILPPAGGRLVALHNNARGYTIHDEIPISDQVSLKQPDRPNDFFLVTDTDDFMRLLQSPYNAVLQQRKPPDDDGSLSRLAARRGVRYVNIEVYIGRRLEQQEMLDWLERHLPKLA